MPKTAPMIHMIFTAALALAAGCAGRHVPDVGDGRYEGPPLTVESTRPT